jgi:hypothetical protein
VKPNLLTETFPKTDTEIVKLGAEVRRLITEAITRSRKTAPEVAEEMSRRLGRPITGSMIYELTRNGDPEREVRLLATWVPAFCEVTGDDRLQRWLAGPRLRELIELGEQVCSMRESGQHLLDLAARIRSYARETKGKRKPTRKA